MGKKPKPEKELKELSLEELLDEIFTGDDDAVIPREKCLRLAELIAPPEGWYEETEPEPKQAPDSDNIFDGLFDPIPDPGPPPPREKDLQNQEVDTIIN